MVTLNLEAIARDLGQMWNPWFRPMDTYYWVCLNSKNPESISPRDDSPHDAMRFESGEYRDRDWALYPRMYSGSRPWEGFIPQPSVAVLEGPHRWVWLGRAEPTHWTEATGDRVRLKPGVVKAVEATYANVEHMIHEVCGVYQIPQSERPSVSNRQWLRQEFMLAKLLAPRLWDLRRNVVDLLGFVAWKILLDEKGWRTRAWDPTFVDEVLGMGFLDCTKRGIHIKAPMSDLALIMKWLTYGVPVHYTWDPKVGGPWSPVDMKARNCHPYNHLEGEKAAPPSFQAKSKLKVRGTQHLPAGETSAHGGKKVAKARIRSFVVLAGGGHVREVTFRSKAKRLLQTYGGETHQHPEGDIEVISPAYEPDDDDDEGFGKQYPISMLSKWIGSKAEITRLDDDDDWVPPEAMRIQHERIFSPPEGQSSIPRKLQAVAATRTATLSLSHPPYAAVVRPDLPPASTQQGTAFVVAKPTVPITVENFGEPESARIDQALAYTPKLNGFDDGDGMDADQSRLAGSWNADDAEEEPDNPSDNQGIEETRAAAPTVSPAGESREDEVGERLAETAARIARVEDERTRKEEYRGRTMDRIRYSPSHNNGKRARREDSTSVVRRSRGHDVWRPGPAGSRRWSLSPPPSRAKVNSRPPSRGKRGRRGDSRARSPSRQSPMRLYHDEEAPHRQQSSVRADRTRRSPEKPKPSLEQRLGLSRSHEARAGPSCHSTGQGAALLGRLQDRPDYNITAAQWVREQFGSEVDPFLPAASTVLTGFVPPAVGTHLRQGRLEVCATTAVRCHVWLAELPQLKPADLMERCLARGMPFRVWIPVGHMNRLIPPGLSKSKGKPTYLQTTDAVMSKKDLAEACTEYLSTVTMVLMRPHARRLLTMGGLLWRIALEYGPPTLYHAALAGPSIDTTLYNSGEYLPESGETDDTVSETEIEVLLGGLEGATTRQRLYLWPSLEMFENSGRWTGEWSARNESWFKSRTALIAGRSPAAFQSRKAWRKAFKSLSHDTLSNGSVVGTASHAEQLLRSDIHKFSSSLELLAF
ncbi:hypothetical protein BV22DRAFT_1134670 [Leucogyrophana mollusca]|uniref:Uncharacterized protein n=1 Tax=Leucogyrophana mollusca TaxID=85980 RepID=A0ACB8AYK5_9AGAM|nr:hypothetical protein BV22DRAFT_1134670 [Leucogyrophana mollusca]